MKIKKKILKLSLLGLILLLLNHMLFASDKPVDDARSMGIGDICSGGVCLVDLTLTSILKKHDDKILKKVSLKSIKESYYIQGNRLNLPPYKCFIYSLNKNDVEIGESNSSIINFKIKKSFLKVGDHILVINNKEKENNSSIEESIIKDIEIVK